MINIIDGRFPLAIKRSRRQLIGDLIREKRKSLSIDQTEFGLAIWSGELSDSAAQTKVSRLERGDYWPPKEDWVKIINFLDLWEEIFDLPRSAPHNPTGLYLDPAWENFIPNLEMMVSLLSDLARKGNADLFYRQLALLCDTAAHEYESRFKGNSKKDKNSFF